MERQVCNCDDVASYTLQAFNTETMKLLKFLWSIKTELLKIWLFFFGLTVLTGDISRIGWINMALIALGYTSSIIAIIAIYHYHFKSKKDGDV